MTPITLYKCDHCNFTGTKAACELHEAGHFNLTIEEYRRWQELKSKLAHASYTVSVTKNETTDKAFDDAINAIIDFEQQHGIASK